MTPCVLALDFTALRDIRSLPPFHGARWAAVMRHACRTAGVDIETCLWGICPVRQGTRPILRGETVSLRLLLAPDTADAWAALVRALRTGTDGEGEFQPGRTLRLARASCALTGGPMTTDDELPPPLNAGLVDEQVRSLMRTFAWRLVFEAPLRLPRPEGTRYAGRRFCDPTFFAREPNALAHLLAKIRLLPLWRPQELPFRIRHSSLQWSDMRYNRERCVTLGGVIGWLDMEGRPDKASALRLALGQYTGAGKNPRFGLGYFRLLTALPLPHAHDEG